MYYIVINIEILGIILLFLGIIVLKLGSEYCTWDDWFFVDYNRLKFFLLCKLIKFKLYNIYISYWWLIYLYLDI